MREIKRYEKLNYTHGWLENLGQTLYYIKQWRDSKRFIGIQAGTLLVTKGHGLWDYSNELCWDVALCISCQTYLSSLINQTLWEFIVNNLISLNGQTVHWFIDDISDLFPDGTCVKLFADDVKSYSKVRTDAHVLQYCLNRIAEWPRDWQLPVSNSKCCVLDLQRLSDVCAWFEKVQEAEDLCVNVDSGLKFSQHVSKLASKGLRQTNLILKFFLSRDVDSIYSLRSTRARIFLSCLQSNVQERY